MPRISQMHTRMHREGSINLSDHVATGPQNRPLPNAKEDTLVILHC